MKSRAMIPCNKVRRDWTRTWNPASAVTYKSMQVTTQIICTALDGRTGIYAGSDLAARGCGVVSAAAQTCAASTTTIGSIGKAAALFAGDL